MLDKETVKRPRLVIAGTNSGVGKTTIVAGMLRHLRDVGHAVQAFKVGPDYIDPGFHKEASGRDCYNLDTWLVPAEKLNDYFVNASATADLSIIEGVMGLYDGGRDGVSSTAEIAIQLQAPVVLVIDCKAMGESAAAIAKGFRDYDEELDFRGVILNRIGSANHELMIRNGLERLNIPVLGVIHRDERMKSPERHLGLTPVTELDVEQTLVVISECMGESLDFDALLKIAESAPALEGPVKYHEVLDSKNASKFKTAGHINQAGDINQSVKIGVAYDEAFSFYYPASLQVLEVQGAELIYFSPLRDKTIPKVEALIFGGGFPEMFLQSLSENESMKEAIREAARSGMPVYAECGGLMYLSEEVVDFEKNTLPMVGLVPARCAMQDSLQRVGYVEATALQDTVLVRNGETLRGHEFHFSTMEVMDDSVSKDDKASAEKTSDSITGVSAEDVDFPWAFRFEGGRKKQVYVGGYSKDNVLASYLHINFAGNDEAVARFIEAARQYGGKN
ncbi:MAG: cobyrinate a,c-diamide synthase [Veillonella sp.]|uniref:cobyrinate a,c-diamide synthase n=1 Tax=Veillonella sp. TaxID=1926307 RepID=UPI0025CBC0B0|nr:cobyrinate a,c-diamide synthase [Veillonella sp.]MBS4913686.1 cobyrinate a,c-diamide synthase [Veillonella sp.]